MGAYAAAVADCPACLPHTYRYSRAVPPSMMVRTKPLDLASTGMTPQAGAALTARWLRAAVSLRFFYSSYLPSPACGCSACYLRIHSCGTIPLPHFAFGAYYLATGCPLLDWILPICMRAFRPAVLWLYVKHCIPRDVPTEHKHHRYKQRRSYKLFLTRLLISRDCLLRRFTACHLCLPTALTPVYCLARLCYTLPRLHLHALLTPLDAYLTGARHLRHRAVSTTACSTRWWRFARMPAAPRGGRHFPVRAAHHAYRCTTP